VRESDGAGEPNDPDSLFSRCETRWNPNRPDCPYLNGDINGNGLVNFDDADPFVALITGGNGSRGLQTAHDWDAENRLVRAGPPTTPEIGDRKVEFVRDYFPPRDACEADRSGTRAPLRRLRVSSRGLRTCGR
jgi:hypothetical protein